MKINKFFKEIYYINLDNRPDRNQMVLEEFDKLGISPKRFSAIVPDLEFNTIVTDPHVLRMATGIMGCIYSHTSILRECKEKDTHVLIFEDDVKFINNYLTIIENALDELPEDWCMLYLGGNIEQGEIIQTSKYLGRASFVKSTHAYAVNKNFIDTLLGIIPMNQVFPLDEIYARLVSPIKYPKYITVPMVAVQQKSYSDIEGGIVEYESWMENRFYQRLKRME